jgi:hypothetical protein
LPTATADGRQLARRFRCATCGHKLRMESRNTRVIITPLGKFITAQHEECPRDPLFWISTILGPIFGLLAVIISVQAFNIWRIWRMFR